MTVRVTSGNESAMASVEIAVCRDEPRIHEAETRRGVVPDARVRPRPEERRDEGEARVEAEVGLQLLPSEEVEGEPRQRDDSAEQPPPIARQPSENAAQHERSITNSAVSNSRAKRTRSSVPVTWAYAGSPRYSLWNSGTA